MAQLRQLAGRALVGLAWLYTLAILYLVIVWSTLVERLWWVAVSNLFAPLFFLPLVALVPTAALVRTRRLVVAVAIPLLLFVALFGGLFLPRASAQAGGGLRVATLNQFYGNGRAEAVVALLASTQADVIAIQELSPGVADLIQRDLGERYPYHWLRPDDGPGGLGLISRYPLEERAEIFGGRGQRATVAVGGARLTVANVHLHFNSFHHSAVRHLGELPILTAYDTDGLKRQAGDLLAELADVDGPLVLLGDFNLGDREPAYGRLRSELRDAFREGGWGFGYTFPNQKRFGPVTIPLPVVRLDYVWLRGALQTQSARVDCRQVGADHCLLSADLYAADTPLDAGSAR